MQDFYILIPPSEGKNIGGNGSKYKPAKNVKVMVNRLLTYDGDWNKLLGVKGKALDIAVETNRNILKSPTLPAIERYSGVVYDGIGYPSLKKGGKTFFDKHVRIVSALFGFVAPNDAIPDYKLKIEKLDAAKYWKPIISKALKNAFIIDLLPNSHRKAIKYENGIAVEFVFEKNGKKMPAGHNGKLVKGRFIRWLCENKVTDPKEFPKFTEDGYHWTGSEFLKTL